MTTLTHARLLELVIYFPEVGHFFWNDHKDVPEKKHFQCADYDNHCTKGKRRIRVEGKTYYVGPLAWFYETGEMPESRTIGHINGHAWDNKWSNLRKGTMQLHLQNVRVARCTNTSGILGAHINPNGSTPYKSSIYVNGKILWLGEFHTAEAAHEAFVKAKRIHHEGCTI